ncbi:MAG: amidohydrolase family protein [Parvularculaceae bacterium]
MKPRQLFLSILFAALPLIAHAEDLLLTNGDILDVRRGVILPAHDILIRDGIIAAIGPHDSLPTTGDESIVDIAGATLLPGLADAHVHLTVRPTHLGLNELEVSTPRATIAGVTAARDTLLAGFTTVRNLGAPGFSDIAVRDAINEGDIAGPRILAAGIAIGITGGHCDNNLLPYEYGYVGGGVADGPWAVREKVRENVKFGADVIKFCGTGGVLSKGTAIGAQQFTLEEMQAIVDEAHLLGVKAAVHAHGAAGINTALTAGVDSVEHASLIDDRGIALAKKSGAFLTMDIYVSDYILAEGAAGGVSEESLAKERSVGRAQREHFRNAVRRGARIAFGTDAGVYPHGLNARQFAYMVEWGMTPIDAIRAATLNNAELFGLSDRIGEIAVGKAADIIAVDQNPLTDIRALEDVDFVMKDGKVYLNKLHGQETR